MAPKTRHYSTKPESEKLSRQLDEYYKHQSDKDFEFSKFPLLAEGLNFEECPNPRNAFTRFRGYERNKYVEYMESMREKWPVQTYKPHLEVLSQSETSIVKEIAWTGSNPKTDESLQINLCIIHFVKDDMITSIRCYGSEPIPK